METILYKELLDFGSDWIWAVDVNGVYTYCSDDVYNFLGFHANEVVGKTPFDFMSKTEGDRVGKIFGSFVSQKANIVNLENTHINKDGAEVIVETNGIPILDSDGNLIGYQGYDRDITEKKRIQSELLVLNKNLDKIVEERTSELEKTNKLLREISNTDFLTNVNNRRSFYEMSEKYFSMAKRESTNACVLVLDLDHFKQVNDTYGHQAGDEVLKKFAENCEKELRESDIFGRMGGEEFAATLYNIKLDDAQTIAKRIIVSTSKTLIPFKGENISITVSIGISDIKPSDNSIDALLSRADKALYKAKESGRNQTSSY